MAMRYSPIMSALLRLLFVLGVLSFAGTSLTAPAHAQPAARPQVNATLSAERTTLQEPVQLTVQFTGASRVQVAEPASDDFQVIGQQTFSNTTIINRQVQSSTSWVYVLRPTRTGSLSTGPIRYATENGSGTIDALTLEVTDGPPGAAVAGNAGASSPRTSRQPQPLSAAPGTDDTRPAMRTAPPFNDPAMFQVPFPDGRHRGPFLSVESSADHAFPGQQIVVDYILYEPMSEFGLDVTGLSEPEFTNAWFRAVTEERGRRTRQQSPINHNNEFYVPRLIRSLIVVPLEAGEFEIPPMDLEMTRVSFRRRESFSVQSPPTRIAVTDPPGTGRPDDWASGHVGSYNLRVRVDRNSARVGDTVLVSVVLEGPGNFTGIRPPTLPPIDGARVLDPTEDVDITYGRTGWLEGSMVQQFAVIPAVEGDIDIPPLSFSYWDPWAESWESTTSQTVSIHVAGFSNNAAASPQTEPANEAPTIDGLPRPRTISGRAPAPSLESLPFALLSGAPLAGLVGLLLVRLLGALRAKAQPKRVEARRRAELRHACQQALASRTAAAVESAFSRFLADRFGHSGATDMQTLARLAREHADPSLAKEISALLNDVKTRRYAGETELPDALCERIERAVTELEGAR